MLFNRGIDTVKITALSNHKPGILNDYIRMVLSWKYLSSDQCDIGIQNVVW